MIFRKLYLFLIIILVETVLKVNIKRSQSTDPKKFNYDIDVSLFGAKSINLNNLKQLIYFTEYLRN